MIEVLLSAMLSVSLSVLLSNNAHAVVAKHGDSTKHVESAQVERGEDDLQSILNTRSVAELDRSERETAKLARAKDDCEAELKTHLLPRGCFRELRLRAKNAHVKRNEPFDQQTTSRLTKICVTNAKQSRSRLDLGRSLRGLPDDCKRVASDRLEDLHYIDEAEKPELSVMRTLGPDIERSEDDTRQLD